jgi:hypothetical protein
MTTFTPEAIEAAALAYYIEIAAADGISEQNAIAMWERDEQAGFKAGVIKRARACLTAADAAMEVAGWVRVPREPTDQLRTIARRIEDIAFDIPAPNPYTPRLATLAVEIRSAAYDAEAMIAARPKDKG